MICSSAVSNTKHLFSSPLSTSSLSLSPHSRRNGVSQMNSPIRFSPHFIRNDFASVAQIINHFPINILGSFQLNRNSWRNGLSCSTNENFHTERRGGGGGEGGRVAMRQCLRGHRKHRKHAESSTYNKVPADIMIKIHTRHDQEYCCCKYLPVKQTMPAFVKTATTLMTSKTTNHVPMSSADLGLGRR